MVYDNSYGSAVQVDSQELLEPQTWGQFAANKDKLVELMTPPLSVLKAAYLSPTPTDVAYVVVVAGKSRQTYPNPSNVQRAKERQERKERRAKKKKAKPEYKLLWDDDESTVTLEKTLTGGHADPQKIQRAITDGTEATTDITVCSDSSSDGPIVENEHHKPEEVSLEACLRGSANGNELEEIFRRLNMHSVGDLISKLVATEKREKKLQKQLQQSGVAVAEDIPYEFAKNKMEEIAARMTEIGGTDVICKDKKEQSALREEYYKLEQEMERYNAALMLTDEYQVEQDALEKKWEDDNRADNMEALKQLRCHMPVNIRYMTTDELTKKPSPNGKFLPVAIVKKIKRTNVLQLLRLNPNDIERMHPSSLESLRVTGLTLTERRALYVHLTPIASNWRALKDDKMTERKWKWFQMMKSNFKESLGSYQRHVAQYGPPNDHPHRSDDCPRGCPLLGRQCPIVADLMVDYSGDYGYTDADEYEASQVRKSRTTTEDASNSAAKQQEREERSQERTAALKKHYKGKLLQVSKANGSCETMDELMDKMEGLLRKWLDDNMEDMATSYSPKAAHSPRIVALQTERFFLGDVDETVDPPTMVPTEVSALGGEPAALGGLEANKLVADFTDALNELKLATLDFAQRAGMQTSGAKKGSNTKSDPRSLIEAELSEEVYELLTEVFAYIQDRMKMLHGEGSRVALTIRSINEIWTDLHNCNLATIDKMGVNRPTKTHQQVTRASIEASMIAQRSSEESDEEELECN